MVLEVDQQQKKDKKKKALGKYRRGEVSEVLCGEAAKNQIRSSQI